MKQLRLTKARGNAADMTRFLAVLERWCDHHGRRGYRIESVPEPGPGTMVWRALKPGEKLTMNGGRFIIE
jgi:hypothetical protein